MTALTVLTRFPVYRLRARVGRQSESGVSRVSRVRGRRLMDKPAAAGFPVAPAMMKGRIMCGATQVPRIENS